MILYLSGPMRGYPNFNFPLFHEVAQFLRSARGGSHNVFNPAEHDEETYPGIEEWPGFASGDTTQCPEFNLPDSLAWDFARILESDGIAMLPGWQASSGAKAERFVAECVGVRVFILQHLDSGWILMPDSLQRIAYPVLKENR